jgi:hypothetical protein
LKKKNSFKEDKDKVPKGYLNGREGVGKWKLLGIEN